eukprot:TRINITY_DN8824_c0_g1_i1.p2 TRINITY_DN8824_c0_g1~~TRINITY_DN8824_c0_g1_i1.p2  ORF type:complete len:105 (+),score=19.09 TRINITY_DN8824_c0_g1_i1:247-561(+)
MIDASRVACLDYVALKNKSFADVRSVLDDAMAITTIPPMISELPLMDIVSRQALKSVPVRIANGLFVLVDHLHASEKDTPLVALLVKCANQQPKTNSLSVIPPR